MTSIKANILKRLEDNFKHYPQWQEIKPEITELCSDLPNFHSPGNSSKFIKNINKIKSIVENKGFAKEDYEFLTSELEILIGNEQLSKHLDKISILSQEVIDKYAALTYDSEGVVAITQKYSADQLKRLTNGVYKKTGFINFFISEENKLIGKVVSEIYERASEIPVAVLIQNMRKEKETGDYLEEVLLFGESYDKKNWKMLKEVRAHFYIYNFICDKNKQHIVYSINKLEIGDYVLTGTIIDNDDYKLISDTSKIRTKLPHFFIKSAEMRKVIFNSKGHFNSFILERNIWKDTFYDYPFTIKKKDGKNYILKYYDWYKELIWAWLLHAKKDPMGINPYPLHLIVTGPKGTGKSSILNCLHAKSGERKSIFSGVSSTMKNLVPSFREKPAKGGYLADSSRFAYLDEFLRCLNSVRNGTNDHVHDESVGLMNDLLEHQKREAGSGNSVININMTARIIATTNPVRGTNTMEDLIKTLDESFLSRWLIYFQSEEDISLVRNVTSKDIMEFPYEYDINDFLAIIDYMQSIEAEFDEDRVLEIYESPKKLFSTKILDNYEARHKHHIYCLFDGIIKTRCLMNNIQDLVAIEEDYEMLQRIWSRIIKSWIDTKKIKEIAQDKRIYYLPESVQHLFYRMAEQKKVMTKDEIKSFALKTMTVPEFYNALGILINFDLVYDLGFDKLKVYSLKEGKKGDLEI